jgi:hypothetical protein
LEERRRAEEQALQERIRAWDWALPNRSSQTTFAETTSRPTNTTTNSSTSTLSSSTSKTATSTTTSQRTSTNTTSSPRIQDQNYQKTNKFVKKPFDKPGNFQ